jgi:CheY-like chemotaxis protein
VGSKVLVVDDESDLRFLMRRFFEKAGHEVRDAGDGAAALLAVQSWRPDLIVTDLMMPVMDGFEFIRRLRADPATATVPIVSVSGNWEMESGADALVAKPYDWRELITVAEGLIKHGRGAQ